MRRRLLVLILASSACASAQAGDALTVPYHATEDHKTIGNWHTTLLHAHGNPVEHYGDFDLEMSRKKLDQAGPIKRFLA